MTNFCALPVKCSPSIQTMSIPVFLLPALADDLKEEDRLTEDEKEIISRLKNEDNPVMAIYTIQK